jgi:hypothetical protein
VKNGCHKIVGRHVTCVTKDVPNVRLLLSTNSMLFQYNEVSITKPKCIPVRSNNTTKH